MQARQCFEWFGTLGYPDFKDARWAEVWTGEYFFKMMSQPARTSIPAFVIGEEGEEFAVVKTSLVQGTLRKTVEGTPADKRIDFEERPFRPFVEERIETLRQKAANISTVSLDSNLDLKSETFVLAYVCWVKGELDMAGELYALAEGLPLRDAGPEENKPMREALEIGFGHLEMSRTVLEYGGHTFKLMGFWDEPTPTLKSRKEVAGAFRRIERNFPASPHANKAAEMAALLERMVEEDSGHPAISPDEWNGLPLDRRIAELVWRLRDQTRGQFSLDDRVDLRRGDAPGSQLIEIGYPAVPALIEALADQRLSRTMRRGILIFQRFPSVLTVGDCARQTLDQITGRSFHVPASEGSDASDPERTREQARAWWAEFQSKGKKQMLIDAIASGEFHPLPLIRQLEKEAPEAVADAVLRGATAAAESGGPFLLVFISELSKQPGPETVRLLKEIVRKPSDLRVLFHAAQRLMEFDFDSAMSAILAEWERFPPDKDAGEREGFSTVAELLLGSGDTKAMRALAADWESRNLVERFSIVSLLGKRQRPFFAKDSFPPEMRALAIALLVRALEDAEVRQGYEGSYGDHEYKNPQVGDFALWALNRIDGEAFPFPPGTGRRLLDLQRIEAANRWRAEHGQSPLPLPESPGPVLPESNALKIAKVTVEPEKLAETPLAMRALGWKGKDLEEKALFELLNDYFQKPTANTMGLVVEVHRRNDLTGVEVALIFREGYAEESESWSVRCRGMIGESRTARAKENGMDRKTKIDEAWKTLEKLVQEALSSPPSTPFGFETNIRASGVWPLF